MRRIAAQSIEEAAMSASNRIAWFLGAEALAFASAALVHYGVLLPGHGHLKAAIAESVIALVLVGALALSRAHAGCPRKLGLAAQGFALLGTCVGLFTIAIGVGPQTTGDLVFHAAVVVLLAWGLAVAWRMGRNAGRGAAG